MEERRPWPRMSSPHSSDLGAWGRQGLSCWNPWQPSQRPETWPGGRSRPLMPYDPLGPPLHWVSSPYPKMHTARQRNTLRTRMTHIRKRCQFSGKKNLNFTTQPRVTRVHLKAPCFLASWPCYFPLSRLVGKHGAGEKHSGASLWLKLRGRCESLGTWEGPRERRITNHLYELSSQARRCAGNFA